MNQNIPVPIRDLYNEAKGCLENDFLTGASACTRLVVTEFAEHESAEGSNHEERLLRLKKKTETAHKLFDELIAIQQYESDDDFDSLSYDGWAKSQLEEMLKLLAAIFKEVYVSPQKD